jgi:polyhydroxyalkanoate synthesis regulator phasin
MRKPTLRRAAALAAAGLALAAGGGAAVAATQSGDDRDAFLGDVAKRLGVQRSALEDAIEDASKARVDAAVKDGRLTEEQADEIKKRIESGDGPVLGGPGPGFGFGFGMAGPGHHVHIDLRSVHRAAAQYLGMTEAQLMTAQRNGRSLETLATRRGKDVAGLKAAMRASAEAALDEAVKDGDMTDADRDRFVADLDDHLDRMIEATPMRFRGPGPGPGFGGHFEMRRGSAEAPDEQGAVLRATAGAPFIL